jgi:hypothetical protein
MATPSEIKKALLAAGVEVYRTRGDVVILAERVRENLLMDAGVYVASRGLAVGFVVRAQRSDFAGDGDERLFERARTLARAALGRGYAETVARVQRVEDPGHAERTLDIWCEVTFEKKVASVEDALEEIRFAMTVEKAAAR